MSLIRSEFSWTNRATASTPSVQLDPSSRPSSVIGARGRLRLVMLQSVYLLAAIDMAFLVSANQQSTDRRAATDSSKPSSPNAPTAATAYQQPKSPPSVRRPSPQTPPPPQGGETENRNQIPMPPLFPLGHVQWSYLSNDT